MKQKNGWRTSTLALAIGLSFSAFATQVSDQKGQISPSRARLMFDERCKNSGERIHKVVQDVEGIFLLKVRPKKQNFARQFEYDDPYGSDLGGENYIGSFVRGFFQANSREIPRNAPPRMGYLYVDALDTKDGQRYRYTSSVREREFKTSRSIGGDGKTYKQVRFGVDRSPTNEIRPRYGVTYEDISTHADRENWIAGSSLKVIDLETNEVLGERVGYMFDRSQGNTEGGRSPWLFAANDACPAFGREFRGLRPSSTGMSGAGLQVFQTLDFVEKVIQPKK